MSRKIAFRGGYDKCLGTVLKTRDRSTKVSNYCPVRGLSYGLSKKLSLSKWFITSREAINFDANTGLYFGIGILSGRFTLGSEEKMISAPLIIFPAEHCVNIEDRPNVDVMWEAPQINIDLLSVLLRTKNVGEEDFSFTQGVLSDVTAEKIKQIESLINKASINSHTRDDIKVLAQQVFDIIRDCSDINQTEISEKLTYELFTNSREKNATPLFFPEAFYFNYNKPSEVTTFYAINEMINELNSGGVQNQLLGELIESTIEQRAPKLNDFKGAASNVDESIFDYIPLGLSESQQQALLNAWKSPVSYIQGPPGTGKSHTICAIIMSAAILGKRVLLISNKHAALTVVDDKLKQIIGCECLNFAVSDSKIRQEQKNKLQALQQDLNLSQRISSIQKNISNVEDELQSLVARRKDCKKLIGSYLQKCNDAYVASKKFSDSIKSFSEKYGTEFVNQDGISQISPSDSVVQVAKVIKKLIEDKELSNQAFGCLELLKMAAFRSYISREFSPLLIQNDSNFFKLTDYVELLHTRDTAELKRKSVPQNQQSLRAELNNLDKKIEEVAAKLIKLKLNLAKYSKSDKTEQALNALASILHYRNPARLSRLMRDNPIVEVTKCLPFWAAEINTLSSVFPFQLNMFDLVIVDEASQVNLPEIIPGFYRGTNFCVVGDEKQLGLSAAGFFALNTTFEGLSWNANCSGISFDVAASRSLIASRHSILDFLLNIDFALPRVTLKEHFRSKPALANFTSEKFYSDVGGLRVMTEVGENVGKSVFYLEQVGGMRKDGKKYVQEEITKTIQIIQSILSGEALKIEPFISAGLPNKPSVGVISFLTEQRDQLRNVVRSEGLEGPFNEGNILIGTPEEFQGNERDIIIITFGLGDNIERYAKNFYEERRRFNVATSRARCFTYAIVGAVPDNAHLLKDYFAHFGYLVNETNVSSSESCFKFPEFRDDLLESDFERKVADELKDYIRNRNSRGANLKLHNQVRACGEKRLDFVIFNGKSMKSLAIEVDGPCHYEENSDRLTESHIRRVAILKRAGWKILHIEHSLWYKNGWLCDNEKFSEVRGRLHRDLDSFLSF